MAKIKFGMMMTDASGKLGGHVFAKNRGGAYVRTKSTPSNPQTTSQMAVRGMFASISAGWSSLTESDRLSFNNLVSSFATTDIFGDLRNPSGKALYQRLNQNLMNSGQALITQCVPPQSVPFAGLIAADWDSSSAALTFDTSNITSGSQLLVFATPNLSAGKSFVKNDYRQIGVVAGAGAGSINITALYTAKFGTPVSNGNFYIGVKVVNSIGQASPLETIKVTAV